MFTLSYSSRHRKARTVTDDQANGEPVKCDIGWLDVRELTEPLLHRGVEHFLNVKCVPIYQRLLSPTECAQLLRVSPDAKELRTPSPPSTGPFPS